LFVAPLMQETLLPGLLRLVCCFCGNEPPECALLTFCPLVEGCMEVCSAGQLTPIKVVAYRLSCCLWQPASCSSMQCACRSSQNLAYVGAFNVVGTYNCTCRCAQTTQLAPGVRVACAVPYIMLRAPSISLVLMAREVPAWGGMGRTLHWLTVTVLKYSDVSEKQRLHLLSLACCWFPATTWSFLMLRSPVAVHGSYALPALVLCAPGSLTVMKCLV
jgi:hypothetical protein